jgi:hypothetical protein
VHSHCAIHSITVSSSSKLATKKGVRERKIVGFLMDIIVFNYFIIRFSFFFSFRLLYFLTLSSVKLAKVVEGNL